MNPRSSVVSAWRPVEVAAQRAERAEAAASLAAAEAERHEGPVVAGGLPAAIRARLAVRYRVNARRQRVTAALQRDHAWQAASWVMHRDEYGVGRLALMGALADDAGWQAAVLTLCTDAGVETLVAASDAQARRVHELEMVVGEGPTWEAMRGRSSAAAGGQLRRLWPCFGPAVAEMGVRAIAAVPCAIGPDHAGSLTVTGAAAPQGWQSGRLVDLARALRQVLSAPGALRLEEPDLPGSEQLAPEDFQPELHQAAGVLAGRCGLPMKDAVALIRAHGYAEERSVADVATEVLAGGVLEP